MDLKSKLTCLRKMGQFAVERPSMPAFFIPAGNLREKVRLARSLQENITMDMNRFTEKL